MKIRQLLPDWLKGISILLMIYGHINHVGSLNVFQKQLVGIIYTFHMPLFLIISGFFFYVSNNAHETGKKIISRLIRPYLIFISIYLLGLSLIQNTGILTSSAPPKSFHNFLEIVFFHPIGAYWFLHSLILIQMSLIFATIIT